MPSSAAAESVLRADARELILKYRSRIVVETANYLRVGNVLDAHAVEGRKQFGIVLCAVVAEVVGRLRRILCNLGAYLGLAVEQTERIAL